MNISTHKHIIYTSTVDFHQCILLTEQTIRIYPPPIHKKIY